MTGNEYQKQAMRTNDERSIDRLAFVITANEGRRDVAGILNGCLGLAGESGELLDMIKKWIFHNTKLDVIHAKKEIGDCLWYIALICQCMGWDLDEIMKINIDKLTNRYPDGFSSERSNNRKKGDV